MTPAQKIALQRALSSDMRYVTQYNVLNELSKSLGFKHQTWSDTFVHFVNQFQHVIDGKVCNTAFTPEYAQPFTVHSATQRNLTHVRKFDKWTPTFESAFYGHLRRTLGHQYYGKPMYELSSVPAQKWFALLTNLHPEWHGQSELNEDEKLAVLFNYLQSIDVQTQIETEILDNVTQTKASIFNSWHTVEGKTYL